MGSLPQSYQIKGFTFNYQSGTKGFEPLHTRTKNEGLTTWRYPKK